MTTRIVCPKCNHAIGVPDILYAGFQIICGQCDCKWILELVLNYDPESK